MKASRAAPGFPHLRRKQLPGKLPTDSQVLAAIDAQTPEARPGVPPIHSCLSVSREAPLCFLLSNRQTPKFPSENPAASHSQGVHFWLMTAFSSLPRISCCSERMFSTAEVTMGPGNCQPHRGKRLSAPIPDGPVGHRPPFFRHPSLDLDPEILANFSELRFRKDL